MDVADRADMDWDPLHLILGWVLVVVLALRAESGWTVPVGKRKRNRRSVPTLGPRSQAVTRRLLAQVSDLEFCEHEQDGFSMWIVTRPGMLLCKFCYQAAQVLAQDILCASCGQPAGNPDTDAVVVVKVTDWFGAHFYLCQPCTDQDLR